MYSHLFPLQWKMSTNLMSKNEEEGAAMLTNRCLTHTYVIYKVSYALIQLRQLAYKLYLWTPASAEHTCSVFCSSSFILASGGHYSHEEEERQSHAWWSGWSGSG